jgi:hypothetical protein
VGPPTLDDAIRATIAELRQPFRAVTAEDFVTLILTQLTAAMASPQTPHVWQSSAPVQRVRCLPGRNLEAANPTQPAAGHISVVLLLADTSAPVQADLDYVKNQFLEPRRLVTTRVHVVRPRYVNVGVTATLYLRSDTVVSTVENGVADALLRYLDPFTGGANRDGWPFGSRLFTSEIYTLLALVDGVEAVDGVSLSAVGVPSIEGGLDISDFEIITANVVSLTLFTREGIKWVPVPT